MAETDGCIADAVPLGPDIKTYEAKLIYTMLEHGLTLRQIAPLLRAFKHCLCGATRELSGGIFS